MPHDSHADELAKVCVRGRNQLRRAAQVLHDDVGSLLAVAGLRLQLLGMDFPEVAARTAEVSVVLDGVMDHLRKLSRALEPSPVRRTGLKNALMDLAASQDRANIRLRYTATAALPMEGADAMYQAIASVVAAADGAESVTVSVSGSRAVTARVSHNGRRPGKSLTAAALLARHAGLDFDATTEKGTIVSIRYAIRRPPRG